MKKFNVEVKWNNYEFLDGDAIPDYITADNEEEAIEFAKDYLHDMGADVENEVAYLISNEICEKVVTL